MGFGRSANTKLTPATQENRDNIFLDIKRGIRAFRLPHGSEEVKIKRHWLALNPDGTWEPKFIYNPNDKRRSVPITVARWNADSGRWDGDERNWRNNPIDKWVAAQGEDGVDTDKMYAQELFYLNVLDLTPVRVTEDGVIHYPDEGMKYSAAAANGKKSVSGTIKILSGSSGDPNGKSLYANLIRLAKSALNDEGEPIDIYDFEIRLVTTGQGKETNRSFNMGAVRPMPAEYKSLQVFDFSNWPQIWPNEAISSLMEGQDYAEVLTEYGIKLYPELTKSKAQARSVSSDEDVDGLFE